MSLLLMIFGRNRIKDIRKRDKGEREKGLF
jgi:hypothetical protein